MGFDYHLLFYSGLVDIHIELNLIIKVVSGKWNMFE